jgi:undecaprenyl-diphosphatase
LTARRAAVAPVLRAVWAGVSDGRACIGEARWRAWLRTVAVGLLGMAGLMVLLVAAGRHLLHSGALDWETRFLLWLGEHGPFAFHSAVFFQTFSTDITLVILLAATAGLAAWLRRPITSLSILSAAIVPDLAGRLGWLLWDRARPTVLHDGIASPGFNAFPSGHTSKAIAVYGFLAFIWIRASRCLPERVAALLILAFIATAVPAGRMTMGVHWPSDVIAGWIVGLAWLALLARGLRYETATAPAAQPACRRDDAPGSPDSASRVAR